MTKEEAMERARVLWNDMERARSYDAELRAIADALLETKIEGVSKGYDLRSPNLGLFSINRYIAFLRAQAEELKSKP